MVISAQAIKELRERSGAGMMDCKKALQEANGDMDAAVDWLRKKGLAAAAKKAGRAAAEGLVAIKAGGTKAAVIELNSETDFVARNEEFQKLAQTIADVALESGSYDATKSADYPGEGKSVEETVAERVGSIGENLMFRRAEVLSVSNGAVATYIHNAVVPGMGKIGVLVALESTGDQSKLEELGRQIAMHVAAARPESLNVEELDPALLEREKEVLREQARASGKPENIIEKMIEGRLRKFYEEVVLLEQAFVIDGKTRIADVVKEAEKEVGAPIELKAFARLQLGEGVEKEEDNFAEEVKKAAGA